MTALNSPPNSSDTPVFNPLQDGFHINPYPTYARLRAEAPVIWTEPFKFWFLSRHADVFASFNNARLGNGDQRMLPGEGQVAEITEEYKPLNSMIENSVLFKDPPDHTRMRKMVLQAFSSVVHANVADGMEEIADTLLDGLQGRTNIELISDYAFRFPIMVISRLMGIPREDWPKFEQWAKHIWAHIDLVPSSEGVRRGSEWAVFLRDYFRYLLAERPPEEGLLHALLKTEDGGARMSEEEVLANCTLFFFAGHDTTTHLLGNGMFALLQDPEQLDRLRRDPSLDEAAITELLRFDSPQQLSFRYALEDVEVNGVRIARGQKVCMGIGAANRDPAVFSEPDRLLFDRPRTNHVAFAGGIHHCAGLRLARLEGRVALRAFLNRFPKVQLESFEWGKTVLIRGLESLNLKVSG